MFALFFFVLGFLIFEVFARMISMKEKKKENIWKMLPNSVLAYDYILFSDVPNLILNKYDALNIQIAFVI